MIPEDQLKIVLQMMRLSEFLRANPEEGQIIEREMPGTTAGMKTQLETYISTLSEKEYNQLLEAFAATAHLKPFEA